MFFFMYYLVYIDKLFEEIELNFLVKGHSKFLPDAGFGMIKSNLKSKKEVFHI